MAEFVICTTDIFDSDCEVLVNPVNMQGVSGAGLAKQFRERFPEQQAKFENYVAGIGLGEGRAVLFRPVFYVATKDHWRLPSSPSIIDQCLVSIRECILVAEISTIAVPLLGCGYGKLSPYVVYPRIRRALGEIDALAVEVYMTKEQADLITSPRPNHLYRIGEEG